jgi:hypothetical protein
MSPEESRSDEGRHEPRAAWSGQPAMAEQPQAHVESYPVGRAAGSPDHTMALRLLRHTPDHSLHHGMHAASGSQLHNELSVDIRGGASPNRLGTDDHPPKIDDIEPSDLERQSKLWQEESANLMRELEIAHRKDLYKLIATHCASCAEWRRERCEISARINHEKLALRAQLDYDRNAKTERQQLNHQGRSRIAALWAERADKIASLQRRQTALKEWLYREVAEEANRIKDQYVAEMHRALCGYKP